MEAASESGNRNVEVEVRSFVSEAEFNRLMKFFRKNAEFVDENDQITFYFSGVEDIRIQKNSKFAKIWMKKGKIHDEHREEIEVKCKKEDFEKLAKIFKILGFQVTIKWFRNRHTFKWENIDVMLDYTKGYGHIIELEKMTGEERKSEMYKMLKSKLRSLDIEITPRSEFERKFEYYKKNWKKLVS